jgi:NitT/TauT family transport system substrate-binding protein
MMMRTLRSWTVVLAGVALVVGACGGNDGGGAGAEGTGAAATESPSDGGDAPTVRLGYFANVTHAPAIVGVDNGFIQEELGDVELETATFNAGTEAIEAMFSGAIDITFIGPNPAINAFAQSDGEAVRIIAGTTSGGAALVVNDDIQSEADLAGKTLATPSLGNTQDVAARAWLAEQGYEVTLEGGGDVNVVPQDNSETLAAFQQGNVQAAWVPEPWSTRLVLEGGGRVFLDEAELWPDGQFVTTHLIVATTFLEEHPDLVDAVLRGLVRAVDFANESPGDAQTVVSDAIEAITGSAIAPETIEGAWANLEFTLDPIASSLQVSADNAVAVGLLDPVDLNGIYALDPLNAILEELGRPAVSS